MEKTLQAIHNVGTFETRLLCLNGRYAVKTWDNSKTDSASGTALCVFEAFGHSRETGWKLFTDQSNHCTRWTQAANAPKHSAPLFAPIQKELPL